MINQHNFFSFCPTQPKKQQIQLLYLETVNSASFTWFCFLQLPFYFPFPPQIQHYIAERYKLTGYVFRAIPLVPKILSTIYPLATQYLQSLQRERTKLYSHTWLKQPPNKPDNMFIDCYRYLYLAISKAFAKKNLFLRLFCVSLYIQSHQTEIEKVKTTNRTLLQRMRKKHG